MVMEQAGFGALDYAPCRYGASQLVMRGPVRRVTRRAAVCLGSTETFGKFVPEPWPALVEEITGRPCINLGAVNAGVDAFLRDAAIREVAGKAGCAVLQIMGAHTLSNRYFTVHPRRNDRFLAPTAALRQLYPEVDFTEFHFTRALLLRLRQVSRRRFETVVTELKRAWVAGMADLIGGLEIPVLLVWAAPGPVPPAGEARIGQGALFVDRSMLAALAPAPCIEVSISPAAQATNTRGMIFGPMQQPMAAELLGPAGQCEVAVALSGPVARALASR